MRTLIVLFVLSACARPRPPVVVPQIVAPSNAAIDYAHTLLADAPCIAVRTADKQPDSAICEFNQVLAYCTVGVGAGSRCLPFADLNPPKPAPPVEQPKAPDPPKKGK